MLMGGAAMLLEKQRWEPRFEKKPPCPNSQGQWLPLSFLKSPLIDRKQISGCQGFREQEVGSDCLMHMRFPYGVLKTLWN